MPPTPMGAVEIDQEPCIGCRFCLDACASGALIFVDPYETPTPAAGLRDYTPARTRSSRLRA